MLSNYATPDMRRKCLELGADRVFDKSNEIDALILYCCRLADGGTTAPASSTRLPEPMRRASAAPYWISPFFSA